MWVSFGFRNKPVAFVSYSGGQTGGVRAIEHLAHIFVETESVPVRNSVVIPFVRDAFDETGQPKNPVMNAAADIMLDDLAWWSAALEKARAAGELTPGSARMRAALTAAQASQHRPRGASSRAPAPGPPRVQPGSAAPHLQFVRSTSSPQWRQVIAGSSSCPHTCSKTDRR